MDKKVISTAGFFGLTAIILGAFGAHALKKVLTIDELATFEVGVKYQMYHALFLLFIGMTNLLTFKTKKTILALTILGVMLFSGSIYLLSTMSISKINFKTIGFLTPIGGALLIATWGLLVFQIVKKNDKN